MSKNYMADIAKLLGVELDEEFEINGNAYNPYRITNKGLLDSRNSLCPISLNNLVVGNWAIIKLPWKPKEGKAYWTYEDDWFEPDLWTWYADTSDYMRLKCGCVFRTKEEALAARPQKYKELTGKEWNE